MAAEWPDYEWSRPTLAASLLFAGWPTRAVDTCRDALARGPRIPAVLAALCATLARAGETGEARRLLTGLEELHRAGHLDPGVLAVAYAGLGQDEAALDAVDRIVREGSMHACLLSVEVFFDPLRDHPRFEASRKARRLPRLDRR